MRQWFRSLTVLMVLLLATASLATAAPKENDSASVKYLVLFQDGKHAAKTLEKLGYQPTDDWSAFANAVSVMLAPAQAERLSKNPDVASVDPEQTFKTMGYTDNLPITWGLQAVKAQEAWNLGARGQGIKVCILDTGIDYSHPEFFKNGLSIIKGSKNFVLDGHPDATDGFGHGTHVAGTIAAQGSYVWGVAPDVDLYIGRVLNDQGSGTSSAIMNGVNWCVGTVHANIISMSLGGGRFSKTEDRTYASAYSKGTLTIAAAGNAGDSTVSYPAGYSSVVSVGAVDSNLAHASFSQYNSDVELAGPGVEVLSSLPPAFGQQSSFSEGATGYTNNAIEYSAKGNVSGPLVECGLADSTTSCTGKPASGAWIALVSRGTIAFSDKANNVIAQGAAAMVITNNDTAAPDDAGSFTFGAAGTWLPAVSVSYNSGVAVRAGGLDTGNVSISAWNYGYYQGTSMATPHAAAVAALAWSAKSTLTNVQIRSILQTTATDLGAAGRDVNFGYGLVQADAAVNKAKVTN
jgi:subtilisin family serine protease